ncbi:MAG: bifunctional 4-hydroxy-3-methylbut-2-enyl diphosphate reductase/30S ribosomal protein S1 [Oscillospiraceae bacterium]|nr:bifunctional 4-hydroxy-3-methylbut-2-enyl diphosphate reductase/30S ribosomal protein S1 [Oscillospiraceae bacterium]
MGVMIAKSAGFCFGVKRAVAICEQTAQQYGSCVTLGPIIHNDSVISELEKKGVCAVSDISDISEGENVIIRSHGAAKDELEKLTALGCNIIDATCPDVKKIHDIVRTQSDLGRLVIAIGESAHPEMKAIAGWCKDFVVFGSADELSKWLNSENFSDQPISVISQTTNSEAEYDLCTKIIKKVCTNQNIFDTICAETCKRQREAADLSKIADVMIVVGGKNSANSLRLADICKKQCRRVIFAQNASELEGTNVRTSDTVVITAGASTPALIIKEVAHKMIEELSLDGAQSEEQSVPLEPTDADGAEETVSEAFGAGEVTEDITPAAATSEVESEAVNESSVDDAVAEPELETSETDFPAAESANAQETFEEMLEKSIKTLHTGEKVTGIVTSITATEVSVDLGTKQSGYIPTDEFTDDEHTNIDEIIKIGDTIEAFVMRVNDVEGMVMLSKKRLDAIKNWDIIEQARENRAIVEGTVVEENKGGVVVNVKGVRVFVPASQTGLPKSAPMTDLVKKPVKLRITEVNQSRRRVVGSIRAVQMDERREKSESLWSDIEVSKQYNGIVKSMTSYGVFVDIGGVDGMIHISELSWTRIKQPSEVMNVGDEVSVYILSFDKDNRKISLGYKKHEDNPWTKFTTNHAVGDVVNVKIVKMMPFGAFAEIYPGVDGLIHISQIADHRIGLPSEVLSEGQMVDVKITEIDNDRKKVSLSIRALIDPSSLPLQEADVQATQDEQDAPVVVYDTDNPITDFDEPDDEEAQG